MNCVECRTYLDLDPRGLTPAVRSAIRTHMGSCKKCNQHLEDSLMEDLKKMRAAGVPEESICAAVIRAGIDAEELKRRDGLSEGNEN